MNIAAILVSFDPAHDLIDAVERISELVDTTVIVDNREGGNPALERMAAADEILLRNHNAGGLAGAYNLALAWIDENRGETTHVLFVDDDSDLAALRAFLTSETTREAAASPEVAAVAPVYRDRRTGLRGRHIKLDRFRFHFLPREQEVPTDVTFVINSMSLWRREALARIGPYSVLLGVDHIDTDYAMRAKRAGYRIVLNAEVEFLHAIGERRSYRFLGRTVQSGGHTEKRRFLIGRNTAVIAKQHGFAYPAFLVLCLQRLAYETIGILAVEHRKFAKVASLWHGVFEGIRTRAH